MSREEPVISTATKEEARDRNRRLFAYALREKKWLILSLIILGVTVLFELLAPFIIARILDRELVEGIGARSVQVFASLLAIYLGATLVGAVAQYFSDLLAQKAANQITAHVRDDVFQHLQRMPIAYFDTLPAGQVVSRVTNDTIALQSLFQLVLSEILMALVMIAATYISLLILSWQVALMMVPSLVLLYIIIRDYRTKSGTYSIQYRRRLSDVSANVNENLQNMDLIQSYDRGPWSVDRFDKNNEALYDVNRKFIILDSYSSYNAVSVLRFLTMGLIIAAFGLTVLLDLNVFSVGLLFIFLDYANKIFSRSQNLAQRLGGLERAKAAADHIFELMRMSAEDHPAADGMMDPEPIDVMDSKDPLIRFEDVSFSYKEGIPVLKDINFEVNKGETIAFVGQTGSGKSTIMNLVQRFYDPQEGSILLGGHDLREVNRETIRRPMAIVLQDPWLFTGNVYDNISLSRPEITEELALQAMIEVGGGVFLEQHPEGLQTEVRQNGEDFSAGERQLISFARALAQDPKILVLDEATAHVDSETERIIQRGIERLQEGRTTLIIAHRLSTIRHAAQIFVLDQGEIAERGNHAELMELGGIYADMYTSQLIEST